MAGTKDQHGVHLVALTAQANRVQAAVPIELDLLPFLTFSPSGAKGKFRTAS